MTSKGKLEKIEFIRGAEAESKILEYLIEQNRPHNPADISANLRVIKKVDVMKCLTYLHEAQKIDMKLFGKQAVYCCKQSSQSVIAPEELKEMQSEHQNLKDSIKELKENNVKMKSELNELEKLPPTCEIPLVMSELKQTWIELHSRLSELANDEPGEEQRRVSLKTTEEIAKLDCEIQKYKTLWLRRRKTCKEAVRMIEDELKDEEAKSNFLERIGLEDDPAELSLLLQDQSQKVDNPVQQFKKPPAITGMKRSSSGSVKVT